MKRKATNSIIKIDRTKKKKLSIARPIHENENVCCILLIDRIKKLTRGGGGTNQFGNGEIYKAELDIIKLLIFHTILNKRLGRKLP